MQEKVLKSGAKQKLNKKSETLKKNPIFLVLLFEDSSLPTEVSSPPHFRFQGGVPWALQKEDKHNFCVSNIGRNC